MIGIIFQFGTDVIEIRIKDSNVFFRNTNSTTFADIGGIKLDKSGVLKEFPDLRGKEDWRQQARDRFKKKIKELKTEEEQVKYIIKDLSKFGYKPMFMQKQGFRPVKIK